MSTVRKLTDTHEITDEEFAAVIAAVKAKNFDDPANHLSDEDIASDTEDTTARDSGKITTIAKG